MFITMSKRCQIINYNRIAQWFLTVSATGHGTGLYNFPYGGEERIQFTKLKIVKKIIAHGYILKFEIGIEMYKLISVKIF